MTRDEAIAENVKYFRTTLQIQAMTRSEDEIRKMAAAQIDFYVAIGVLKLDEPKSLDARLATALGWPEDGQSYGEIIAALKGSGIKLTEA